MNTQRLFLLVASLTPDMRAMVVNHLTFVLDQAATELDRALADLPELNRAMPAVGSFAARVRQVHGEIAEAARFVETIGGAR